MIFSTGMKNRIWSDVILKKYGFVLLLLCSTLILASCGLQTSQLANSSHADAANAGVLEHPLQQLSVSNTVQTGFINDDIFLTLRVGEALDDVQDIINSGMKQTNLTPQMPHYDLQIEYRNKKTENVQLYLSGEGKKSAFIFIDQKKPNVYWVSKEATETLHDLFDIKRKPVLTLDTH